MIPWLVVLFFISLLLILIKRNLCFKKRGKLPPGPPGLPIIGNLHQLGALPHRSLWNLSKKYGIPVMHLRLGTVPTVIVSSPESARQVLKVHDIECCSRPHLPGTGRLSYNYLDVAFSPYDAYWKEARKICVLELFSSKRVESFRSTRDEETAKLIDSISQSASCNASVNLSEKLMTLTASVTCRAAFGMSFQGSSIDNERFQEVIHEALVMLGSFAASNFFPHLGWIIDWITGLHGRRERSFHELDAFYEQTINFHLRKRRTDEGQEDIVDVLLKLERQNVGLGDTRLTRNHIKAILMNILLGGIDTSAITMVWTMAELARNPRVMKKLQAEIRGCIGKKGEITHEDIHQLEYLKMVIKETWRMHPPAPLLVPREAMSEFSINGYTIYPKTLVQVNVWAIGRDPDVWKDPEEFFPERFVDYPVDFKGQNFELLPFGGGRRICPGMQMGTVIVEFAIANLLYHFNWELPGGMLEADIDMEEGPGVTVYKKLPLELVPVKYHPN